MDFVKIEKVEAVWRGQDNLHQVPAKVQGHFEIRTEECHGPSSWINTYRVPEGYTLEKIQESTGDECRSTSIRVRITADPEKSEFHFFVPADMPEYKKKHSLYRLGADPRDFFRSSLCKPDVFRLDEEGKFQPVKGLE